MLYRHRNISIKILFLILLIAGSAYQLYSRSMVNTDFIRAVAKSKKSVLYLAVYNTTGNNRHFEKTSYGSATIVTASGYIITNYHVVKKGNYFQAVMYDGTELEFQRFNNGKYYLADHRTDIAILKLKNREKRRFPYITMASSSSLSEGEWVIAIGNPYGLRHSVTSGIVSSVGRDSVGFAEIEDFIQTDVPINPGNSGGPLVNLDGKMVGINSAIRTLSGGYQGISFAIPTLLVKKVFNDLVEYGRVRRGWLGLLIKESTPSDKSDMKEIRVASVIKKSPASVAGLLKGDIIREIDGERVFSRGQLVKVIKGKPIGTTISMVISRDERLMEFNLEMKEKKTYGGSSSPVNQLKHFFDKYGLELSEDTGKNQVVVSYISPLKSGVHKNELKIGDTILKVNNKYVFNINQLMKVYKGHGRKIYSLEIIRENRKYNINLNRSILKDR